MTELPSRRRRRPIAAALPELDADVLARVGETHPMLGIATSEAGVRYAMAKQLRDDDADRLWRMWCFAIVRAAERDAIDARRDA